MSAAAATVKAADSTGSNAKYLLWSVVVLAIASLANLAVQIVHQ